ncbi:relaxase/mobilization nuclease domain-containing protein [Subtercola boreus]
MAIHGGGAVLDRAAALEIAKSLDRPRKFFGVEVTRLAVRKDADGVAQRDAAGAIVKERVQADVWHCSLSLAAEEGQLSDEKWARIATDFVHRMGFAGDESGRADCRWVAVRHGVSKNGNDHIHIAVSLVREDGTKAAVHRDFQRSQTVSLELEREHGLQLSNQPDRELGERGITPGAREAASRRGQVEVDAHRLERAVRAAAVASVDEAEFVRRMRQTGVLIRPRYATGRDDVIAGYSVALRPEKGQPAVWHGGGKLARDLTLPELRKGWPDRPETATDAAAEWRTAGANPAHYQPVKPGRETAPPTPEMWQQYARDLTRLQEQMRGVPAGDRDAWARVAKEASGAFAAWSQRIETTPGPLAEASRSLARSAHLRAYESKPRPVSWPTAAGGAAVFLHATQTAKPAPEVLIVLQELEKLSRALRDMHHAAGDARRARDMTTTIHERLRTVTQPSPATRTLTATTPRPVVQLTAKQEAFVAEWRQGQMNVIAELNRHADSYRKTLQGAAEQDERATAWVRSGRLSPDDAARHTDTLRAAAAEAQATWKPIQQARINELSHLQQAATAKAREDAAQIIDAEKRAATAGLFAKRGARADVAALRATVQAEHPTPVPEGIHNLQQWVHTDTRRIVQDAERNEPADVSRARLVKEHAETAAARAAKTEITNQAEWTQSVHQMSVEHYGIMRRYHQSLPAYGQLPPIEAAQQHLPPLERRIQNAVTFIAKFDASDPEQQLAKAIAATTAQQEHDRQAAQAAQADREAAEQNRDRHWTPPTRSDQERDRGYER